MKKNLSIFGLTLLMFACTSNEVGHNAEDKTNENSNDTIASNEVVKDQAVEKVALPKSDWKDIKGSSYEIIDDLLTNEVKVGSITEYTIWNTTEGIVIDFADENGLYTGAKLLPTPDVNEFNVSFEAELKNVVGAADSEKELVINWNTMDGRSGMIEGFEMEVKGLFIIDLKELTLIQDVIYEDHQMEYFGDPTDEDLENEDYHAKTGDNTAFEICTFSHKIQVELNKITFTDYYKQQEGKEKCELKDFTGTFTYDETTNSYLK